MAKDIFEDLGAQVIVRNDEPNGTNINRGCGSTHIDSLQSLVYDTGADIGFAYDGDADRCMAVDDEGKVIDGDHILYICGKYLKEQGRLKDDTVVTTVMSNMGLYKAFDKLGIRYEQTAVGDKYVCENMMENNYSIGGEQSGHIIFKEHAVTGDGILTSLMVMEAWLNSGRQLSELTEDLVIYPQLLVNVKVRDKLTARLDADVQDVEEKVKAELGDAGRLLLRESGTEPLIRVMVEAENDEMCKKNVDRIVEVLRKKGHIVE
jgi:phosphoglucosamine mutase